MKKFFYYLAVFVGLVFVSVPASAAERVMHYACKSGDDYYALTVHENIVKLQEQAPPHTLTTFRILRSTNTLDGECGKGGWMLNGGVMFCYATQGYGGFKWHGHDFDCNQADTE